MRCPTCKTTVDRHAPPRPFCSERCKLIDLGHWLSGSYAIPGEPATEEDLSEEFSRNLADDDEPPRRTRH